MKAAISIPPRRPNYVARAAFSAAMAASKSTDVETTYTKHFGDDDGLRFTRAAVLGATTTAAGWASELVAAELHSFLTSLAPESAASRLIALGPKVTLNGFGSATFPARADAPQTVPWVAESGAIPVVARTTKLVTVGPSRKVACATVFTEEMADRADASVFEQILREDVAYTLDLAYFGTAAGSASAHAGLLNGVTPLAASVAGGSAAVAEDLSALISAVSTNGSGQVVIVTSTGRGAAFPVTAPEISRGGLTVLGSAAVPAARVIAIDPISVIHGTDPAPEIDTSKHATLHMSDTPLPIGTPGAPPVVAAPTQSMFQTASIAVRIILAIAFAKRRSDAVAYIDAVDWA